MKNLSKFEQIIRKELSEQVQDDDFAHQLYASLCNTVWHNKTTGDTYSCTWRYAGGIVASMRCLGEDYLNFYCSGGEGNVHPKAYKALNDLGYTVIIEND
jgi:hypothetical protein